MPDRRLEALQASFVEREVHTAHEAIETTATTRRNSAAFQCCLCKVRRIRVPGIRWPRNVRVLPSLIHRGGQPGLVCSRPRPQHAAVPQHREAPSAYGPLPEARGRGLQVSLMRATVPLSATTRWLRGRQRISVANLSVSVLLQRLAVRAYCYITGSIPRSKELSLARWPTLSAFGRRVRRREERIRTVRQKYTSGE